MGPLLPLVLLVLLALQAPLAAPQEKTVQGWAEALSRRLRQRVEPACRRQKAVQEFAGVQVEPVRGDALADTLAQGLAADLAARSRAIQRVAEEAERLAVGMDEPVAWDYSYVNAKRLDAEEESGDRVELQPSRHFFNLSINTSMSAVHVPVYVQDRSRPVIEAIHWSQQLDPIFERNLASSPGLSWQFFGSSTGFSRLYPAHPWPRLEPVDLYDCRTRDWYTKAAASRRHLVILLDRSGSMAGMRIEIAKHVVSDLLDTLTDADKVAVFTFANATEPLVECFGQELVEANSANVYELKDHLRHIKTEMIANFSSALATAYRLLLDNSQETTACNKAIMLLTDGIQNSLTPLFRRLLRRFPAEEDRPRVFTFLINRELLDTREAKNIARDHRGYYVHLSTYAEVREQVLKYVDVLARPLALSAQRPDPVWSPMYAWWARREDGAAAEDTSLGYQPSGEPVAYSLMTSMSVPVLDRRPAGTDAAALLGVAGTDVPIADLKRLLRLHRIGPEGYAVLMAANGYVLVHPDLRPSGELKPTYNRVDLVEVEISRNALEDSQFRHFSADVLALRHDMVQQRSGNRSLAVKYHYDGMRRVDFAPRHYYFRPVNGTPLSLAVVLNGAPRRAVRKRPAPAKLPKENWTVHPEWVYCRDMTDKNDLLLYKTRDCDSQLVESLFYDLEKTAWFEATLDREKYKSIEAVFVSTGSGLTRYMDLTPSKPKRPHFGQRWPRAIDEAWYKRAILAGRRDNASFIYSQDEDEAEGTAVLVASAVFVQGAPVAVVGAQFNRTALQEMLVEATANCSSCFLLDEDGLWVASSDGLPPDSATLPELVRRGVYRQILMPDYQGVCSTVPDPILCNSAPTRWALGALQALHWLLFQQLPTSWAAYTHHQHQYQQQFQHQHQSQNVVDAETCRHVRNRTRAEPCDRLLVRYKVEGSWGAWSSGSRPCDKYAAARVPHTNLLLVAVGPDCSPHGEEEEEEEEQNEQEKQETGDEEEVLSPLVWDRPVEYNESLACLRARRNAYPTPTRGQCFSYDRREPTHMFGGGARGRSQQPMVLLSIFLPLLRV